MTATQPVAARFVGQSVTRKEDRRLVTGHGQYVDDVVVPRMLHAAFLRAEVPRASITRLDASAARDLPGVVAVYTWTEFNGVFGEAWHAMLGEEMVVPPPLAIGDVRYVGDPIAVVVAETRYIAEDACELIEVDYEPRPAVVDYATAAADTDNVVHAGWGLESNAMMSVPFMPMSADLDEAFTAAEHVVECTIEQNRYVPVPMETRGILASYNAGRDELDIVCSTQSVHETRNFFARYLRMPEAAVRVTARDVGGGFGQKMFVFREECAVVLSSRLLGRPVKWIEDRRENLLSAPHSRNEIGHMRLAVRADGAIEAITIDHVGDVGAYPACPAVINPQLLPGPYKIPRLGFSMNMVWTNTMGKGAYRGPWMFETTAREMAIDVAARRIGMDPVELRRKNLLAQSDLPFLSPGAQEFVEITPLETLEQALELLDYEAFRKEQKAARSEGRYLGVGFSVYVEPTSMAGPTLSTEAATVRVEASGRVVAFMGTTSHGQSVETTMAQVVAEHLGVDYDDVTIVQADTQATPYGPGTGGSRTAVIAGGAARAATLEVRDKVLAVAAHAMEAAPDDLEIAGGIVSVKGTPTKSMTLRQVATAVYVQADTLPPEVGSGLEATVRFRPSRLPTWSNATHVCVVEIDAETFRPSVLRYIVSEDCGRMINPRVVEGQIFGGVVQGLGGVLLENFVYDGDGNPLTTTFMDYLLPTATEVPDIEVGHIESVSTTNPGGFKGLGEGGAIGSHAAVANAVGDALAHLGVEVTRTPLGPNDIFELIEFGDALAVDAYVETILDGVVQVMSTAVRIDGYRQYLAERNGTPDLLRRRLERREGFFEAIEAHPVRSRRTIDRNAFFRNLHRRHPEPGIGRELAWLLATAKLNQAERFGVGLGETYGRSTGNRPPEAVYLELEEHYHTRLLAYVLDMFDLPFEVIPPAFVMRQFVKVNVFLPERPRFPFVGAAEMAGCVLFDELRRAGVALFEDEPDVAARIDSLYGEILTDEIGHVGYCAARCSAGGRALMRRFYPPLGRLIARQTAEILLVLDANDLRRRLDRPFDVEALTHGLPTKTFVAVAP